jgi:AmiR/NasT family two-component response regulator
MLTLYQRGDGPIVGDLSVATVLADAVGAALLRESETRDLESWGPWDERARIDQATGIVIAQLGIPPEDAHALLRAHAYAHDTTIHAIASDIIERRLNFNDADQHGEDQP